MATASTSTSALNAIANMGSTASTTREGPTPTNDAPVGKWDSENEKGGEEEGELGEWEGGERDGTRKARAFHRSPGYSLASFRTL
jgi:hypothetical protein